MAGRPPVPSALKKLRGTDQPCRMNPDEPVAQRLDSEPPKHLSRRARKAYRYAVEMLDGVGVLSISDALAVESLAATYAQLWEARDALAAYGSMTYSTMTEGGAVWKPYPEVAIVSDCERRLLQLYSAFGMTPSARTRVAVTAKPEDENPFLL